MAGGTMFQTNQSALHEQDMADWTPSMNGMGGMRRKEEFINDRPMPSPTYSQASIVDSAPSPYAHPSTIMVGLTPFQPAYPIQPHHLQPVITPHYSQHSQPQAFYPGGMDYDVFSTPSASVPTYRSKHSPAPFAEQQDFASQGYEGAPPLLTTASLSRSYDSTIPQYYAFTRDRNAWVTPDKDGGQKRKRHAKETPPSAGTEKSMKTPRRSKMEEGTVRAPKRIKVEEGRTPAIMQLPTPPSTGREMSTASLPAHLCVPEDMNIPPAESVASNGCGEKRRGVGVTRCANEGRKLVFGDASIGDEETKNGIETRAERKTPIPVLATGENGHASLSTDLVLASELDWLENGGRASPPSSPDAVLIQTPVLNTGIIEPDEDTDTPNTKANKAVKRIQAFEEVLKAEEPMICTRIDMFGRVAVRKDVAIKFLGLDGSASLVEEMRHGDEEDWVEHRPIASGSRTKVKPSWPDDMAPWSLAGGSRKERVQKEESEKGNLLRRYLETASDESSDEEIVMLGPNRTAKGKGKSVSRLVSHAASGAEGRRTARRPAYYNANADAKSALLTTLRNRALPMIQPGVVACVCGTNSTNGLGSMIACHSCKTWHHLVCNGLEQDGQITPRWWCPSCEHEVSHSTPARAPHAYAQSQERSSAFKGEMTNIALAPSPMFMSGPNFGRSSHALQLQTPLSRNVSSPGRPHRQRILSYSADMWPYAEDAPPSAAPSTPAPSKDRFERFSTPRIDDAPFDVHSTPSRHLDFNFSQPSLFSLTPLGGGRGRIPSAAFGETPLTLRARMNQDQGVGSRHGFLRDLGKPGEAGGFATPGHSSGFGAGPGHVHAHAHAHTHSLGSASIGLPHSPQTRWPHPLMGAHNLSPSPFGHRRSLSGNKMSSMRSSSRSGLGLGLPLEEEREEW